MVRFVSQDVMLGERISVGQFVHSETASRLKINNNLPENLLPNARKIVAAVERAEQILSARFVLLAGYRTAGLSVAVGGKKSSYHVFALAVDGFFIGWGSVPTCRKLSLSPLPFVELESKRTAVHLAHGDPAKRKLFMQRTPGGAVVAVKEFPADGFMDLT